MGGEDEEISGWAVAGEEGTGCPDTIDRNFHGEEAMYSQSLNADGQSKVWVGARKGKTQSK